MRIGIDASRAVAVRAAGVGHYSRHLIESMIASEEHTYTLYANGVAQPQWSRRPNAEWRDIPLGRLWTHVRLSAEIARRRPDALFVPAHVVPPVHPAATVVTIHDLGYIHYPDAHPRAQRLYLHLSTLWSIGAARMILADSQATVLDLGRFHRVPARKIMLAYPGVSQAFHPQPGDRVDEVRRRYRLPAHYLLFVGTIQPRKNVSRLLAAHALVPEAPTLVLAGSPGWLSEGILRQAEAAGDRAMMLGYVPDDDLPALLTGADALTLPSLYEGFGIPALEAMACGTPVVTSRTSSLPEVVGDCGILVDPLSVDDIARGIGQVCHDRHLAQYLGDAGRARARQFTWAACAQTALTAIEMAHASTGS